MADAAADKKAPFGSIERGGGKAGTEEAAPGHGDHKHSHSLKRLAFQTIRPVVSRKKRVFSAHFGPGGAVQPPRAFTIFKGETL